MRVTKAVSHGRVLQQSHLSLPPRRFSRCYSTTSSVNPRSVTKSISSKQHSTASRPFPTMSARPALSPSPFPNDHPAPATFPSYESGVSASRDFTSSIIERLSEYSRLPQRGVTLEQLMAVGEKPSSIALLASAQFLAQQLPIRLARRVMELDSLPYGLSQTPAVQTVKGWYKLSFKDLLTVGEPRTASEELSFTAALEAIYERHANVVPLMALGVLQMKKKLGATGSELVDQCPFLLDFLNRFYASRMGIRLLISQHLSLHHPSPGHIGTIALHARPLSIIRDAVDDASRVCARELAYIPHVALTGDEDATFPFLPAHLHHIIFELTKNSMRAVVERQQATGGSEEHCPPITIVLSSDDSEFAVRLSDVGGGIPRKDMPRIWSYLYTTIDHSDADKSAALEGAGAGMDKMAGWGYGLPLARLYARFFGGDLSIMTVPNHGLDAYLYLPKLSNEQLFLD